MQTIAGTAKEYLFLTVGITEGHAVGRICTAEVTMRLKRTSALILALFMSSLGITKAAIAGGSDNVEGIIKGKKFRFQIDGRSTPTNSLQHQNAAPAARQTIGTGAGTAGGQAIRKLGPLLQNFELQKEIGKKPATINLNSAISKKQDDASGSTTRNYGN